MDIYSEKKAMKDLNSLYAEAVYGKPKSAGQELAVHRPRVFTARGATDDVHGDDDEHDAHERQDQHPTLIGLLVRVVLLELNLLAGHLTHLPSMCPGPPVGWPRA